MPSVRPFAILVFFVAGNRLAAVWWDFGWFGTCIDYPKEAGTLIRRAYRIFCSST